MAKMSWSGLVVLTAITLGSALGLGAAPVAQAQDARAPMVRSTHAAPARNGAMQRRDTSSERVSAIERRADKRPAQMSRNAPTRERGEVVHVGHGTRRTR